MKKILSLVTLFLIFLFSSFAQKELLGFEGKVYSYGKSLKDAKVEVYQAGELVFEDVTKGSGKFDLELEPEKQYMVEVSAEEKELKVIWINTSGTAKLGFNVPKFGFDVNLKKHKPGPDEELSKIPVVLIKYQPEKREFYMDDTYGDTIKNKKRRVKETGLQRR